MSTLSMTCSSQFSGVAGLNTRPDLHPFSRMRPSERSMCRLIACVAPGPGLAERLAGISFDWLLSIANLDIIPDAVLALPKRGAAAAIGGAYALFLIPISAFVGTSAVWWLLIPGLIAIYGLWWFIDRSYKDGEILETLELWPDHIRLTRDGPHKAHALWEANPYWVSVHLRGDGPVPAYLTLKGNGREVELGRFLTENERRALHSDITLALSRVTSRARG